MTSPITTDPGELFSDGGDMSDIVELPVTEDESNDDVPVKELSSDNILTVSLLYYIIIINNSKTPIYTLYIIYIIF